MGINERWDTVKIMMAFVRLPSKGRSNLINKTIDIGVNFFLSGDPSKADFPRTQDRHA
jgi:hypothetical protein